MEKENNNESKRLNIRTILIILLFTLPITLIFGVIILSGDKQENSNNQYEENNIQKQEEVEYNNTKIIELVKENEELIVNPKMKIKFIGTAMSDIENAYQYRAEIYLNNQLINDNFFTGNNIWSNNVAATFEVIEVSDTYIIKSFIAKQCNGAYVLVLKNNGEFTTYSDVSIQIDSLSHKYTITKCNDCMLETTCNSETSTITTEK